MKKILLKVLSILVFISMVLPSSSTVFAAKLSNPPVSTNITITNNAGVPDILNVTGLAKGDIVNVYSSSTSKKSIGTGTVKVAGIVKISIKQLGSLAGNVYVSVKSTGLLESNKIKKAYNAEVKSTPLDIAGIIVTNNAIGTKDTVVVPGLAIGDIVKVYSTAIAGVALGTATATKVGAVTVSIPQIGAVAGSVYISVTSKTLLESDRTAAVTYLAEVKSTPLDPNVIVVTNNAVGTKDTVMVPGLAIGDIIKVYSTSTGEVLLGTATAKVAGNLTVSIDQLGAEAGKLYVSVTSKALLESDTTSFIAYDAEAKSVAPDPAGIVVTNNAAGTADTVVVPNLSVGDIVNVYSESTGGILLGTATSTVVGDLTVSIPQVGAESGNVYVTVTSKALLESDRTTAVAYAAEAKSTPLDPAAIVVTNNAVGTADTVVVPDLSVGDIINVYSESTGGVLLGTATSTVAGDLTVSIPQVGSEAGNVYVTVINKAFLESDRTTAVAYAAEAKSTPLDPGDIVVTNNAAGTADTVVVPDLSVGDIINVYSESTGGILLGTATEKIAGDLTVSIPQIGVASGNVYVTVTNKTLLESDRTTAIAYAAESKSTPLDPSDIVVTNNASGTADTVVVQNLFIGDIVKVYSSAKGGALIGTSIATASGLTVSIKQLGVTSGKVYVSVIRKTFLESDRTIAIAYVAEAKSTPLDPSDIVVSNNATGTADTVVVQNLDIGDIVKVYSSAIGGIVIGTSTAKVAGELTVSIKQIGATGGNLYISVIRETFLESDRTLGVSFASEAKSTPLDPSNIVVINNADGTVGRVLVQNLAIGDIINVYSSEKGGSSIGTGTAIAAIKPAVTGDLMVSITKSGVASGSIYVSVTREKLLESDRILATKIFS